MEQPSLHPAQVLIVGTVFKQQERKPSILKELSEGGGEEDGGIDVQVEPQHLKYTHDTDR